MYTLGKFNGGKTLKMQWRPNQMDENEMVEAEEARTSRRRLLQGAAAAGVGAAVIGAPGISVVPAYGTTISSTSCACYQFVFSTNNPRSAAVDGKGWGPTDGGSFPASSSSTATGKDDKWFGFEGTTYTWNTAKCGSYPGGSVKIKVEGCVNTGNGKISVDTSTIPVGFKLVFASANSSTQEYPTASCGSNPASSTVGVLTQTVFVGTGGTGPTYDDATLTVPGGCSTCDGSCNDPGRIYWAWSIDNV